MPNYLKLNMDALPKYNVQDLFRLAMEQNLFISETDRFEPDINYYTLKVLTAMPFEQWARLIEIENINNNDRN